jgi:hypothetical protein
MSETDSDNENEQGLDQRVSSLETGQQTITGKVDQILGILGKGEHAAQGTAQTEEAAKLDAPSNVADMVRRQLDERDAKAKADAAAKGQTDRLGALETTVSELAEKPPAEPVKRRHKIMGWT